MQFLPILFIFIVMYFLMIRPQMKRQKEMKTMIDNLQKEDEVVTTGGLVGKIKAINDSYLTLELNKTTEVVVQKTAVLQCLPKGSLDNLQ